MQANDPGPANATTIDIDIRLEQIAKIAQNARTSWFGLLGLLLFVGVTLMGHRDSDFFAYGAETALPVINISVPTVSFFIAAPALTGALYVYFHIYLHNLWIALAKCPPRIGKDPLEERVYPTMLCTAALAIRRRLRQDDDEPVEGSRAATVLISVLMVWLFGPLVLGVLWWRSMPYHHEWLTLWLALWLWFAMTAGGNSLFHLLYLMRTGELYPYGLFRRPLAHPKPIISLVLLTGLAFASWDTTEGGRFVPLVRADLAGAELTRKPANWLHYEIWLEDWEYRFRSRECPNAVRTGDPCPNDKLAQFREETGKRWEALTQSLESPDLGGADLRGAVLARAYLSGAFLAGARLESADLRWATLEGATLSWARLDDADLLGARLEGAHLLGAGLEGAILFGAGLEGAGLNRARLDGADLSEARLDGAHLSEATLKGANLRMASLDGADLSEARLDGAHLSEATLKGANLRMASLKGADLVGASLEGADLSEAKFDGANFRWARLENADLRWATLKGANLSKAMLVGVDLSNTKLEGVDLSEVYGLTRLQVSSACGDEHTRLPDGLTIRTCDD